LYTRFDDQLLNIASAVCNDSNNRCGLTTLSCTTGQTVLFNLNGGTATGSVACTGSNAIANGTSITVTAAGAGYNNQTSSTSGTTGTPSGGTATYTGSIALTPTFGSAGSGKDADFMICYAPATACEYCYDTSVAKDTNQHRMDARFISSGKVGVSFYNSGTLSMSEISFCSSGCTVTVTPSSTAVAPLAILVGQDSNAKHAYVLRFMDHFWNLTL
jgi:hypothetical protein